LVESNSSGAGKRREYSGASATAGATSGRPGSWESLATMKAKIVITPKKAVLDPQGKTVQNALALMGYTGVGAVHVGKYLEIELTGADKDMASRQIAEACHKILSNPVIEDYRFEIE
jgi:phosphoribosylformylglycinamidine synthase subunit PurS